MKNSLFRFLTSLTAAMLLCHSTPVGAQLSETGLPPSLQPFRLGNQGVNRPLKSKEKQTLEDIFRRVDLKTMSGTPVDLSGTAIPGLSMKGIELLGMNYFVIANSNSYKNLSDVYAENRAENKPNFVTVDSIIHPYFAFSNGMLASAVEEGVYKDLYQLLKAMVASSIADYRRTDDDEVKDDIQRNLAYLCVALKILEPRTVLPDIGGASELVDADFKMIEAGKSGRSRIFSVDQDFGTFRPWGFMALRPRLKRFYVTYQWLSRMQFPLNNSTNNTFEGGGNSFRRAVLLYRSIVLAKMPGQEAPLEKWNKIAMAVALLNFDSNAKKRTIIAPELQGVFKTSETDLARLLHSLSQPFLRTKLLLSVRNQRPVELNARSVFEMDQDGGTGFEDVVFRLFPLIDPPELAWLREEAHNYTDSADGANKVPIGLINLHAHGAQAATNLLSGQLDTLDPGLTRRVPRLERLVKVINPDDAGLDRHWTLASSIFKTYPDTVQIGLRSDMWLIKELQTAMCAWIDSYSALLVIPNEGSPEKASPADSQGSGTSTASPSSASPQTSQGSRTSPAPASPNAPAAPEPPQPPPAGPKARPARFHYLEPRLEVYRDMQIDCQNLIRRLTELGYMPARYLPRSEDFMRLFKRLAIISEQEIKNEPISLADFNLLANIDRVLAPVDCPVSTYIYLDQVPPSDEDGTPKNPIVKPDDKSTPDKLKSKEISTAPRTGATMGIGRPGKLFIVCSTSQGSMLTRGGCYTYYEIQGGPQRDEHWERKLTYNLLLPPDWTRKFTIVHDDAKSKNPQSTKDESQSQSRPSKRL